ncbi:MAG TPA: ABC transporter permease [Mucilaginibacter sp.]|nr:ABC transporter permease [Mucilaginibacter sp.]
MHSYTFHITFYDLLFVGIIFVGLSFAAQLWFKKDSNRAANRFLGLALGVTALWIAGILNADLQLWTLPLQFSLAFGPLIYFYVRKTIWPESRLRWTDLLHFGPGLLLQTTWMPGIAFVINPLTFISVGIYLYLSHRLIERFYGDLKFNGGDRYRFEWRWLDRLLAGLGLALLLWIPLSAIDYWGFHFALDREVYYPLSLLMAVMVIRMGVVVFPGSAIEVQAETSAFQKSSPSAVLRQKGNWLKKAVESNCYYQDPELSLASLAEKLGLTTHELSRLINTVLKKSFNDFINEYRVRDVAAKMQDPAYSHITLLGIAFDSGFNSKATFNRTFKQLTGKSPVEYKALLKKEVSTYNLRRTPQFAAIISNHNATPKWSEQKLNRNYMFKNYFKVALRSMRKNIGFSVINVIGLSAGLAVCLLIVLYVKDELSFDSYYAQAENIYRLDTDIFFNGTQFNSMFGPAPLAPTLKQEYPLVEQYVRLRNFGDIFIRKGDQNIHDHNAVFADSTFFRVFSIPMVAGNGLTALNEPNSVVIDETTAKKYFNSTDVVGKTLYVDNHLSCKITGVFKDIPPQSHFHFRFIRPMADIRRSDQGDWLSDIYASYVLVRPGVTQASLQKQVDAVVNNHLVKQALQVLHLTPDDLKKGGNHFRHPVIPLTAIHLHSNRTDEFEANGNITYVYIFSAIAIFILLIACVNFMNLSTARSTNRAKEVGIRKATGALRSSLIIQFLTESMLMSFISLMLATGIAALLLPLFNQLAGKQMSIFTIFASAQLPALVGLIVVVGCIAGSYPAFYLSSFQPVQVLKGNIASGFKSSWLRSGLVVFQFFISIALIIGTIVIFNQLNYIRNTDIGYKRDRVLVINNTYWLGNRTQTFRQEALKIPGVQSAAVAESLPTEATRDRSGWSKNTSLDAKQITIMTNFFADRNYIPTMGMQMAAGRNFSSDFPSDSSALIINETAVKLLGLKDPLNQTLYRPSGNISNGRFPTKAYHIIGVVKDFNFSSMHNKIGPLTIALGENYGDIVLRINTRNIPSLIGRVESEWKSMAPGQAFNYSFLDADYNKMYKAEQRTGKLFSTFAVFAILIACLGLLGLVTYAAEQRTKEIGVRKVLGASVGSIVAMLSKDFTKLVLIASLIAFPVSWWAMNKWLQSFAYRIDIAWWVFVAAGVAAIVIALATVSFQAIKAAVTNPVKSLRSE